MMLRIEKLRLLLHILKEEICIQTLLKKEYAFKRNDCQKLQKRKPWLKMGLLQNVSEYHLNKELPGFRYTIFQLNFPSGPEFTHGEKSHEILYKDRK